MGLCVHRFLVKKSVTISFRLSSLDVLLTVRLTVSKCYEIQIWDHRVDLTTKQRTSAQHRPTAIELHSRGLISSLHISV